MWLVVAVGTLTCYFEYQGRWDEFLNAIKPLRFAVSITVMILIMVSFHVFKRSRITYALGIAYLFFLGYIIGLDRLREARRIAANWNEQIDKPQTWHILVVSLILTTLFSLLCYRFIFGLPSRRFYRLTQK